MEGRLGLARRGASEERPALGVRDPQGCATASATSSTASRSTTPTRRWRSEAAPPRCGRLVGAVLEYETLERAVRVLSAIQIADVARRFELDPRRVKLLPAGVLVLEKLSELLGQPLQIGKGGLREGIILDLLNGSTNGSSPARIAA